MARHLSNLSITAAAPSFVQPDYHTLHGSSYLQGNPPPYTEYAHEINYLIAPYENPVPVRNMEYWQNTRDDAVRLLGEQAERCIFFHKCGCVSFRESEPLDRILATRRLLCFQLSHLSIRPMLLHSLFFSALFHLYPTPLPLLRVFQHLPRLLRSHLGIQARNRPEPRPEPLICPNNRQTSLTSF